MIYINYMKKIICSTILLLMMIMTFAEATKSSVAGNGSVSPEDYALSFFTKFNKTQEKLTYMHKKGNLAKVGTETVKGNISGTLFYDVKIKGMGAVVTLRYTNYCDEEGWVYDGEILTYSNMSQDGHFEGRIKVSGIEPLEISYDKVIMKNGAPGDGFYTVSFPKQQGTAAKVDYSVYLKSKK